MRVGVSTGNNWQTVLRYFRLPDGVLIWTPQSPMPSTVCHFHRETFDTLSSQADGCGSTVSFSREGGEARHAVGRAAPRTVTFCSKLIMAN